MEPSTTLTSSRRWEKSIINTVRIILFLDVTLRPRCLFPIRTPCRTTAYQLADDVSLVRGSHQFSFGANAAQWRTNQYAYRAALGTYNFNGTATGLGMADFLTGNLTSLNQGSPTSWADRQTNFGMYAADVWKFSPRLTVNYGLRWEPFLPLHLTMGAVYGFNQARFDQGIRSTVFPSG